MGGILKTVLLLALPASGKSEVRRYLAMLPPDECSRDFHMGPTVQLDDFPYVHLMRRVDEELEAMGESRIFYAGPDASFSNMLDWGTLIEMVNLDYYDLINSTVYPLDGAAKLYLDRLDQSSVKAGAPARISALPEQIRAGLIRRLDGEAKALLQEKHASYTDTLDGKTLVIEFARGGAADSSMPLPAPFGYNYSLGRLAPEILADASILYIWTTPEESRRKNAERTNPDDPGSILHHGVPIEVLLNDYGCDDMDWLESSSDKPGLVNIGTSGGGSHYLPMARFDNRVDKTSFLRNEPSSWTKDQVSQLHSGLLGALQQLANHRFSA